MPNLFDPTELKDLIEKVLERDTSMGWGDFENCMAIVSYLDEDPEPLRRLARGEK